MNFFRFDIPTAVPITLADSQHALIAPLLDVDQSLKIACLYFGAGGTLGMQAAQTDRLFLIVSGRGWVRTPDVDYVRVQVGQAVFWHEGEQHALLTHNGMVVFVVEGTGLQPELLMHSYEPQ